MKQAVNATTMVLLVSLLSGCSSAEEKACKAAKLSQNNYNSDAIAMQADAKKITDDISNFKQYEKKRDLNKSAFKNYELSMRVITTYKECFTPEQVVEAQLYLDKYSE
jgi:hypothetical protein